MADKKEQMHQSRSVINWFMMCVFAGAYGWQNWLGNEGEVASYGMMFAGANLAVNKTAQIIKTHRAKTARDAGDA